MLQIILYLLAVNGSKSNELTENYLVKPNSLFLKCIFLSFSLSPTYYPLKQVATHNLSRISS